MRTTPVFEELVKAWRAHPRWILEEGGTRSGKTYAILQLLHLYASTHPGKIISVVSETMPHLRRGAIRDFRNILESLGAWEEDRWARQACIYTYPNGAIIEFFSADQPGKVLGPARDVLAANEGINIPWEVVRQLAVRTRDRIVVDYNPARSFWAHEEVQPRENVVTLRSTYKDNTFLTKEQIAEIEANKKDAAWWRVYGEGLVGEITGQIYAFEQIDALPTDAGLREFWGLDFGFTHDPTALVHVLADTARKVIYFEQQIYRRGMINADIAAELRRLGLKRGDTIYADCAEPKSIEEIKREGFNIVSANKGAPTTRDRLLFQIQWMQGWSLKVTKASVDAIRELRNYTWATDTDGKPLDRPIDDYNHALDALRYGCWTHLAGGRGVYHISIR